jgi:hypothetical protein
MNRSTILQAFLFAVFFSIGAAAVAMSVLSADLMKYYHSRQLLVQSEKILGRLESLNKDYDTLLKQLESDPNLARRLAPAALGAAYADPNAVYPRAKALELAAARKALFKETTQEPGGQAVPKWVINCAEPKRKFALFIAGAGLIVVSLVCFTPSKQDHAQAQT